MREILFRGKTYEGEWVQGDLNYYHSGSGVFIAERESKGDFCKRVDPKTIGQYTGLTDSNGKKIFEGDIVSYRWRYSQKRRFCIEFVKGEFVATPAMPSYDIWAIRIGDYASNFEIIGNTHDNPELLGGDIE